MKKNFFVTGMTIMVLIVIFGFIGCASMMGLKAYEEENETSKAIFKAATDLVVSKSDGINCDAFIAGLKSQFSGMEVQTDAGGNPMETNPWITFRYQEKTYELKFTQRVTEESRGGIGNHIYYLTSITSCIEKGYRKAE